MRHPAAIPALALTAGIVLGIHVHPFVYPDPLLALCAASMWVWWRGRDGLATLFITGAFVAAGARLGFDAQVSALEPPLGTLFDRHVAKGNNQLFATIEGRLRRDAARGPEGVTLAVAVERVTIDSRDEQASGGLLVGVGGNPAPDQILQWRGGRRVRIPATLRRPATYLNDGVPDARRQFAWRGITLVGSSKSGRLIDVLARGSPLSEALASARAAVRRAVHASVGPWGSQSAAVVTAILIGDRAGLDDDLERRLQEAGTYHVIAISGGNIAILAGLCIVVLRWLRGGPRFSAGVVMLFLTAYAFCVEGGSSVGRATLMAVIYLAARVADYRSLPGNVAAVSAAALLSIDPLQIMDAGFALTFGATLGILVGVPRMRERVLVPRGLGAVFGLLAASVCAEVVLLPVSASVFSRVTAAGLLVNFAAIPLMTLIQVAGMAALFLVQAGTGGAVWAGWIAHWGVRGLLASASLVDVAPWLSQRVPPPALVVVATYYVALAGTVFAGWRRTRCLAVVAACAGWIVIAPRSPLLGDAGRMLRVTFLDVGQGDAALVRFPDGRTLSVDAGGLSGTAFDIGGRVVSPALWATGIRRLDYMSLSHGDPDHIGGAPSVFRDFRPFEVWEGVPVPPHAPTARLRALAGSTGTVWRTLQSADAAQFGDVLLLVHHPARPDWERQRVRNDDSEVLEIRYGGVSFVFTGDIGVETERAIADTIRPAAIRILKVPHHGSATSSSPGFLRALGPDVAVISCGRGNPYGHPAAAVLSRYRAGGAAVYRTDLDGAVTVETDGRVMRLRTFTNRRLTLRTTGR